MAPFKRKTYVPKPYVKKRRTKSKYVKRKRNPMTLINRSVNNVIAPRFISVGKYSGRYFTGSSVSGISAAYGFNLNSIYDPDRTGGGHQMFGRDQLALLYNRYRVFKTSWKVQFYPVGASSSSALFFVVPRNDGILGNGLDPATVRELPYVQTQISSLDKPTTFSGSSYLPKLTGQTPAQFKAGLEYQAQFNADPTEFQTLSVGAISAGSTASYQFEITLIYHFECFDPLVPAQS